MYCEVVYESGASSVMEVQNKDEALLAMAEQHRRAKVGELSGPQGIPANRVVKGLLYSEHPDNYNPGDSFTVDELKKMLPKLLKDLADENGIVAVGRFASEVRGLTHPMKRTTEPHESKFRMEVEDVVTSGDIDLKADELQATKELPQSERRDSLDELGP